ncbi:putative mitochondrial membrane protein FMP10 [Parachaetomium inaequale]|uniref:Mitochondrial membrane protein FMP10 n=1 Tax=Parachaetomium inaequale TaxID=2588326 RepID=A0AAN6SMV9_9PEZI|nr:putative mitochondrial membrane protein FMP10 [Parachaetomium inaequale]
MPPRIQYRHLLRAAQCQRTCFVLPARSFPTKPLTLAPQTPQLQPFSTSPSTRQEPRQEPRQAPIPSQPATAPPVGEPVGPPPTETTPPPTTTTTTTTTPPPPPTADPSPSPNPNQQPKKKPYRLIPRLTLAIACTLLGLSAGSSLRLLLSPPDPPQPHTEEDAYTTRVLHDQAARLPIVQQLTAADPAVWESWDAYESLSAEHRAQHITAGALAGSRGVGGYQRVFWNKITGELVTVIYFGSATTGWPGVVHGGCLATVLDESCGRAAFKDAEWGGKVGLTAKLGLEYKRVTMANGFYVVRVKVRGEEELPEQERGKRHYKCWVDASVEDAVTGAVTVTAEALFVGGQGKGKKKNGGQGGEKAQVAHVKF